MTNHELIKKVIGNINPVGESNTDAERFKNLKELCTLAENILYDIDDLIHKNIDAKEASVKNCVGYARHFMKKTVKDLVAD